MTSLTLPRLRARSTSLSIPRVRPELAALLVLAGVLNLWALSRNGYANEYYAAAVRSMASSWHNFLFNSFDAAGVMTVDKPPLSTWVQALSVRAFGYSSLSILVPQALMGIGSVALTYDLVRRRFGRFAGFVGGAVLATTPIAVAVARHNNPDALLVLLSVAALWFIVRAFEDGRTRWVLLAGAMVGLGFETKMMAAVLIVPAIAAAYLWVAPRGRVAAVRQLFAGGAVMAVIGLAWPVLMWLTPASSRPWISGTADNSIWSLIWGYNGVGRLQGQAGGPGGMAGGPGGGGGVFGGPTGPLRLLQESIGGQAGWLLGFAVVAGIAILVSSRLRRDDARTGWLIATGGAFATIAIAFSAAEGIFHPYYVSLLAPFTAALVGAGAGHAREHGGVLAALMIGGGIFTTLIVLGKDATDITWASGLVVVAGVATALVLVTARSERIRTAAIAVALAALLAAPASWAVQTTGYATSGTFPAGGPAATMGMGGGGGPGGDTSSIDDALAYIRANGGGTLGVSGQNGGASQAIISSDGDVAGLGGFSGRESQVSVAWLADAVRDGRIRWVLTTAGGMGGPADGRTGSQDLMATVEATCKAVTTDSGTTIYDCQGFADALAAQAS